MNKINQLEVQDTIYIAGLFDEEGSINLSKAKGITKDRFKTPSYILRARVRMTDEHIVRWLHIVVGGRFYGPSNHKGRGSNSKPYYEWCVAGKNAVEFLLQIYPYLKIKKFQADVAFKYGRTLHKRIGGIKTRLPDEVISRREELRSEMLFLNRRGLSNFLSN